MNSTIKRYAGIGSTKTPKNVGELMTSIAVFLESRGYGLNSGGANGADDFFEKGASPEYRKIYLPWNGFNGRYENGKDYVVPPDASQFTLKYHPKPSALSSKGKLFMSKNAYQVLGDSLSAETKVDFVVCWYDPTKFSGTSQAVRIGVDYNIPIFNIFYSKNMDNFVFYLETFII